MCRALDFPEQGPLRLPEVRITHQDGRRVAHRDPRDSPALPVIRRARAERSCDRARVRAARGKLFGLRGDHREGGATGIDRHGAGRDGSIGARDTGASGCRRDLDTDPAPESCARRQPGDELCRVAADQRVIGAAGHPQHELRPAERGETVQGSADPLCGDYAPGAAAPVRPGSRGREAPPVVPGRPPDSATACQSRSSNSSTRFVSAHERSVGSEAASR